MFCQNILEVKVSIPIFDKIFSNKTISSNLIKFDTFWSQKILKSDWLNYYRVFFSNTIRNSIWRLIFWEIFDDTSRTIHLISFTRKDSRWICFSPEYYSRFKPKGVYNSKVLLLKHYKNRCSNVRITGPVHKNLW